MPSLLVIDKVNEFQIPEENRFGKGGDKRDLSSLETSRGSPV